MINTFIGTPVNRTLWWATAWFAAAKLRAIIPGNKTRQGYARKRTLKLAGYFFVGRAA